ncbi:MAG: diguanylate cyclase [Desulfotalea sp.]
MDDLNVLFVDDEKFTLHSLERLLRKETYGKYFAEGGADALKIIEETPIHIVISDMKMPEMDGLALLKIVKAKNPEIIRMVLSAYTQTAQLLPCINTGEIFRFITKPLEKNELKNSIRDACEIFLFRHDRAELVQSLEQKSIELRKSLTRQSETEHKLRLLCVVDDLTGLYNRRQLMTALQQTFSESKRYKTDFSCFMLSIDKFKILKDTYGHEFGDVILKDFAQMLKNTIRSADIAFRFGEEDFFVLLPQTELEDAKILRQRIIEICRSRPFGSNDNLHNITVSIGAVSYTTCHPTSPEHLVQQLRQ